MPGCLAPELLPGASRLAGTDGLTHGGSAMPFGRGRFPVVGALPHPGSGGVAADGAVGVVWPRGRLQPGPAWRSSPSQSGAGPCAGGTQLLSAAARRGTRPGRPQPGDPGVAAGVGFLGAGEIMMPSATPDNAPHEVRGLSSAASIWFTAALGITVAASSPVLALVALVLALITLSDRPRHGDRRSGGPGSQ